MNWMGVQTLKKCTRFTAEEKKQEAFFRKEHLKRKGKGEQVPTKGQFAFGVGLFGEEEESSPSQKDSVKDSSGNVLDTLVSEDTSSASRLQMMQGVYGLPSSLASDSQRTGRRMEPKDVRQVFKHKSEEMKNEISDLGKDDGKKKFKTDGK